jgi:CheY-like chemotaxis protein
VSAVTELKPTRILIADDEPSFALRLSLLLEHEGYRCETVPDGGAARERLHQERFDVLIADIHMPGNETLELVKEGPLDGVAVVLVSGEPTLETAIEAIRLPVFGYLVKPFRLEVLKVEIERALELLELHNTVERARARLGGWAEELDIAGKLSSLSQRSSSLPVEAYVETTIRNVTAALVDVARITAGIAAKRSGEIDVCRFFQCPRLAQYREAVNETIEVLEKTKRSFKSKDLGLLRQKLEVLKKTEDI